MDISERALDIYELAPGETRTVWGIVEAGDGSSVRDHAFDADEGVNDRWRYDNFVLEVDQAACVASERACLGGYGDLAFKFLPSDWDVTVSDISVSIDNHGPSDPSADYAYTLAVTNTSPHRISDLDVALWFANDDGTLEWLNDRDFSDGLIEYFDYFEAGEQQHTTEESRLWYVDSDASASTVVPLVVYPKVENEDL